MGPSWGVQAGSRPHKREWGGGCCPLGSVEAHPQYPAFRTLKLALGLLFSSSQAQFLCNQPADLLLSLGPFPATHQQMPGVPEWEGAELSRGIYCCRLYIYLSIFRFYILSFKP